MNIFVVSQPDISDYRSCLILYLSGLSLEEGRASPTIVVDKICWELSASALSPQSVYFALEDFFPERNCVGNGNVFVDGELIRRRLGADLGSWIVIECGLHDRVTIKDLVAKIARFSFHFNKLRGKNIVFLVPELFLGHIGRYVNAMFNSLPINTHPGEQGVRYRIFWASSMVEKACLEIPFFSRLVGMTRRLFRRA